MSKKRGAEKQITKDNDEDVNEDQGDDGQQVASSEKLAARQIVKVKRKITTGESTDLKGMPKFNFAEVAASESSSSSAAAAAAAPAPAATAAAAAPAKSGFGAFMQPGMWACPDCDLMNKKDAKKCISCTAPNPSLPAEPKGKDAAETAVADAGISFGAPDTSSSSSSAAAAAPAGAIDFGAVAAFGSDNAFTFGAAADSGSAQLSFGDVASSDSNALSSANPEFPNEVAASDEPNPNAEQFKGKKAEGTGEENDKIVHKVNCRVYILKTVEKKNVVESKLPRDEDDSSSSSAASSSAAAASSSSKASNGAAAGSGETEQKYVEVGSGELHINTFTKPDGTAAARLVLRAEKVQRLVVNAPIFNGISHAIQQEKYVRFISLGLDEPQKMTAHLLRFKTKSDATDVNTHIKNIAAALPKPK